MEKVRITQELAKAIESVKTNGMYDNKTFEILEMAVNQYDENLELFAESRIIWEFCKGDGINILMKALVNGYEVEKSKEDQVREVISNFCNGAIVSQWVIDDIREIYEGKV